MSEPTPNDEGYFLHAVLIVLIFTSLFAIITTKWQYSPPKQTNVATDEIYYQIISPNTTNTAAIKYILIYSDNTYVDGISNDKMYRYIATQDIFQYTNYDQWESDKKKEIDKWTSQGYNIFLDDWVHNPPEGWARFNTRAKNLTEYINSKNKAVGLPRTERWTKQTTKCSSPGQYTWNESEGMMYERIGNDCVWRGVPGYQAANYPRHDKWDGN